MARRPYRVVFTRPEPGNNGLPKPGTIVKADLRAAEVEAKAIARSGGTAEVHYVADSGRREVIATYRPSRSVRRIVEAAVKLGPPAVLVLAAGEWLRARWRRLRG